MSEIAIVRRERQSGTAFYPADGLPSALKKRDVFASAILFFKTRGGSG
jgi:hypothetical protein